MNLHFLHQVRLPALFSFVAGFVDTVGFVALFGLFTAHVTGNFVLIGASLFQADHVGLRAKLLALPFFVLAVGLTTVLVRRRQRAQRASARAVVLVQAGLLVLFMVAALALVRPLEADASATVLTGMLGVFAMGVHNAAARLIFTELAPTTVMTGNVTQVVIDTVDLWGAAGSELALASRQRVAKMLPSIVSFVIGALSGATTYRLWGFSCLALAIAALLLIALSLERKVEAT